MTRPHAPTSTMTHRPSRFHLHKGYGIMKSVPLLALLALLACSRVASADAASDADDAILKLYESGTLFNRKEYKTVRKAFAQRFEARYELAIRNSFGTDYDELKA